MKIRNAWALAAAFACAMGVFAGCKKAEEQAAVAPAEEMAAPAADAAAAPAEAAPADAQAK